MQNCIGWRQKGCRKEDESLNFTLADLSQDAKKSKDAKDSLEKTLMLMKP